MRVLWLCNIMLPMIAEQLHREINNKEGWLSGLAEVCLKHQAENDIALAVAFPVAEDLAGAEQYGAERHLYDGYVIYQGRLTRDGASLDWFAFREDTVNPHAYYGAVPEFMENLELPLYYIVYRTEPDVVHCFGTEYPHTLAMCRAVPDRNRVLIGIQGLCKVYADAYFADLPEAVIRTATLRDVLKRDTLPRQQKKFALRGAMEQEAVALAGNVTGRTTWDRYYTSAWNPDARYFKMNETLRADFYTAQWRQEDCEPRSIFLSQGDYPIKGLHYMLLALPRIREEFPDVQVYVAGNSVIGDGSVIKRMKISAYGKYLRKLMQQGQLWECVHFLGRLSAEQMKRQYLKSNLFVCCSSIENSPNSLGEAMLLGMPCVSADVGGISSIFTDGEDGILYRGSGLEENARNLADAVIRMFRDPEKQKQYTEHARKHALVTHDPQVNYQKLVEIYKQIAAGEPAAEKPAAGESTVEEPAVGEPAGMSAGGLFVFVSNYINHHQIPFCNALYERLGENFYFIQTEPMEEERIRMGWQDEVELPYVKYYYEEPESCDSLILRAQTVLFGGVDEERYIEARLQSGKPVIRYSERLYKEGQWKAVSPRGLLKKYHDHTRYRKAPVYLLCAGAYVPSDFHIVRAYPQKMFRWGYFPETKHYDLERLMQDKKAGSILWAARFLDWKHPELPLLCAKYLKQKGCSFHMNIVGGGNLQPLVDRLMEQYGLSDVVTLLGYRTPDEVRRLMEQTDIYLATSDRKEGWGAVINEAMNSGCAVVADHRMGAVPYLIRPGENGCVYPDGKSSELFRQVEMLLADRARCQKLGREAYRTITEVWNAENAAERLLELAAGLECAQSGSCTQDNPGAPDGGVRFQDGPCSVAEVISERKMLCKMGINR